MMAMAKGAAAKVAKPSPATNGNADAALVAAPPAEAQQASPAPAAAPAGNPTDKGLQDSGNEVCGHS